MISAFNHVAHVAGLFSRTVAVTLVAGSNHCAR
jgi:hypothetical protein